MNDKLYQWLTTTLKERGWSDSELARRAHLSSGGMSMIMTGQRTATADFCIAIATALNVDVLMVLRLAGHLPPTIEELRAQDTPLDHLFRQLVRLRERDSGDFSAAVRMLDGLLQEEGRLQAAPQVGPPENASGGVSFSRDETSELIRFIAARAADSGMDDVIRQILQEAAERAAKRERERETTRR